MTAITHVVADSTTMLRRNLLHMLRYPALTISSIVLPVVLLLLFVYVFGGTLGDGLAGAAGVDGGGTSAYLDYVVPGMLVLTIAGLAPNAAISIAMDMTQGIVARFRSMAISRAAVLTGQVLGNVIQAIIAVALVFGVALLMGYRPEASSLEWLLLIGMVVLVATALVWLGVAMGMAAKSVESASNTPLLLILLPFLGSGFVPTDSMPEWLRWFTEYQPFTPIMETIRSLLDSAPVAGWTLFAAIAWCVGIAIAGYAWARAQYVRKSVR